MISVQKIKDNLEYWYSQATLDEILEGEDWYSYARDAIRVAIPEYPLHDAAAVVAALSPRNRWERNITDAAAVFADGVNATVATFWSNKMKACDIVQGTPPEVVFASSPKVYAFWKNLCGDESHVTLDVWAIRAATGGKRDIITQKELRERVTRAYVELAEHHGLTPAQYQAIVWVSIRNRS